MFFLIFDVLIFVVVTFSHFNFNFCHFLFANCCQDDTFKHFQIYLSVDFFPFHPKFPKFQFTKMNKNVCTLVLILRTYPDCKILNTQTLLCFKCVLCKINQSFSRTFIPNAYTKYHLQVITLPHHSSFMSQKRDLLFVLFCFSAPQNILKKTFIFCQVDHSLFLLRLVPECKYLTRF